MAREKRTGVLIAGGGLAGSLAALAMARQRPDVPLLLVAEEESFGGDRLWSFFDTDVDEADRWLVEPLISHNWPGYYVAFPGGSRRIKAGYNTIRSSQLDRVMREALRPDQYRLGVKIVAVREDSVILAGGERVKMDGAIDARSTPSMSLLDMAWENFVGREYRFKEPHRVDRPVLMDGTVDQSLGYRSFYCLPFAADRLLVEECHFSLTNVFDAEAAGKRIDAYVDKRGWKPAAVERQESGSLPLALGGDFNAYWRVGGARVAKLGTRGGLFHPATGYALPDAVRSAMLLTQQRDFSGAALHDLFEAYATAVWKKREYYRGFNQALHREADPAERVMIVERLFNLDPAVVARFYAAQSTMIDRMKIAKR